MKAKKWNERLDLQVFPKEQKRFWIEIYLRSIRIHFACLDRSRLSSSNTRQCWSIRANLFRREPEDAARYCLHRWWHAAAHHYFRTLEWRRAADRVRRGRMSEELCSVWRRKSTDPVRWIDRRDSSWHRLIWLVGMSMFSMTMRKLTHYWWYCVHHSTHHWQLTIAWRKLTRRGEKLCRDENQSRLLRKLNALKMKIRHNDEQRIVFQSMWWSRMNGIFEGR